MRTLFNAAFLATTLLTTLAVSAPATAADLDHYYEPGPARVLPPPPPPPCGVYDPCVRPRPRFGYVERYRRWSYGPRPYRYGYGEDHYGYAHDRPPYDRYGFDRPGMYPYQPPRYGRLDHYGDEERRRENDRFDRGPRGGYGYERDPYDRG